MLAETTQTQSSYTGILGNEVSEGVKEMTMKINEHRNRFYQESMTYGAFGWSMQKIIFALLFGVLGMDSGKVLAVELCTGYELFVSGWNSDNVSIYDGCTGDHLRNLDVSGNLLGPMAIVKGTDGHLYIASEKNDRVLKYHGDSGAFLQNFIWDDPSTAGVDETGGLDGPTGMAIGPDGNLYVGGYNSHSIHRYNRITGAFIDIFVASGTGGLNGPDAGMVFGPDGHLYVPSNNSNRVLKFDGQTGALILTIGGGTTLSKPRTVLFRPNGNTFLVSSRASNEVLEFDSDSGALVDTLIPSTSRPTDMKFGPDGLLYVTSDIANIVWRYDPIDGSFVDRFTQSGSGGLDGGTYMFFHGEPPPPVPAASTWGLICMVLVLSCAGTLLLMRRTPMRASL